MKSSKLTINKFRIAELQNPQRIIGGVHLVDDPDTGGRKCVKSSREWVENRM